MKRIFFWLISFITLGALAGFYFLPENQKPIPQPVATPAPAPEPSIHYPVASADSPKEKLPTLAESDSALSAALAVLFGHKIPKLIRLDHFVHRIVATVDNLPRDHVAPRLMPVVPVTGLLITVNSGENLALSPKNAERYQPYVRLADVLPSDALVALYARFYPLFQEQYENLGYPDKYFNDRVVEVIDHLLATPEIDAPPRLVQPRVLYEFADPKLETLSAGQKLLLRVGHRNELKLKEKLREIRAALVSMAPASALRAHDPRS